MTQVDLDDEALAEKLRLMGASAKTETVNGALRASSGWKLPHGLSGASASALWHASSAGVRKDVQQRDARA